MFPTIRESAAVVSIILLLMLFLPSRLPSRYRKPIVVALLVVVLMLLAVPLLLQYSKTSGGAFGLRPLYCPWRRFFVRFPGEFSAACTLPGCALRGAPSGANIPAPVGRAHLGKHANNPSVLGASASIMGRSFLSLLGSGSSLCPAPMP
jgi:hypothetical protein